MYVPHLGMNVSLINFAVYVSFFKSEESIDRVILIITICHVLSFVHVSVSFIIVIVGKWLYVVYGTHYNCI